MAQNRRWMLHAFKLVKWKTILHCLPLSTQALCLLQRKRRGCHRGCRSSKGSSLWHSCDLHV